MTDSPEEPIDIQIEADVFISPLKRLATEAHEIFVELQEAGFPERVASQIMAQMLSEALLDRSGDYLVIEDDEDEDEDDEDDDRVG